MVKIRDVKKLWQDIKNDPIIKDQMADLGCLLVSTFGNFLVPVLIAVHTANNLDLGNLIMRVMKVIKKIIFCGTKEMSSLCKYVCCYYHLLRVYFIPHPGLKDINKHD